MENFKHISEKEFLSLEPGDKLLVNRWLEYLDETYGIPYGIVDDMEELEGEVVTVDELHRDSDESESPYVLIKEDRGHYSWAPECFECKVERSFPDFYEKNAVPPDNTAKIATYDFSYSSDGKIVCRNLATKETATARCHEEDIFSLEVGELVAFAHMLGYDVDHCGSNDRFTLIRKKPAYHYGEKILVDCDHPDCTKYMKENYKDQPGIILSSELDKKSNTYMYKVIFKDEQIFKLQESILKDLPINFVPGVMDLKESLYTIKKK